MVVVCFVRQSRSTSNTHFSTHLEIIKCCMYVVLMCVCMYVCCVSFSFLFLSFPFPHFFWSTFYFARAGRRGVCALMLLFLGAVCTFLVAMGYIYVCVCCRWCGGGRHSFFGVLGALLLFVFLFFFPYDVPTTSFSIIGQRSTGTPKGKGNDSNGSKKNKERQPIDKKCMCVCLIANTVYDTVRGSRLRHFFLFVGFD